MTNYAFTDEVRKALARAREEAVRLQHEHVGTEHILLGVLRDDTVGSMLRHLGAGPEEIRGAVEAVVPRGSASSPNRGVPYTSRAKKLLEFAMAQARESKDSNVRTEHLLLGLLREEKGVAATVLNRLGVTLERTRSLAPQFRSQRHIQFRVRIDDTSDRSIYEQIVAQVTEAVATGDLRPGERLPTVRQLADDLDIAPGTVARAYSELERQGIVITEGARGTRVAERTGSPVAAFERSDTLAGLLRPVVVAAYHLGASAVELRTALEEAMRGIFDKHDHAA